MSYDGSLKFDTKVDEKGFEEGMDKLEGTAKSGFSAMAKTAAVAGAALATAATAAITGMAKTGLEYNSQMEDYTTNFKVMLGGMEAATEKVESLKVMAAATPFEMGDLSDATQKLLAMGVASENTEEWLQKLGDISLGNADKFNTLTTAFGKMQSAQKVTLEYITPMIEAGFNPLNSIAEKTGESMEELYERLGKGGVAFDEVKTAINEATAAGGQFYQGMQEASKTTSGLISTLQDNVNALFGEVMEPASKKLTEEMLPAAIEGIDDLTTALRSSTLRQSVEKITDSATKLVKKALNSLKTVLPAVLDGVSWLIDNGLRLAIVVGMVVAAIKGFQIVQQVSKWISSVTGATNLWTAAQAALNAVMAANPIGLAITAIAALAGGIALLALTCDDAAGSQGNFNKRLEELDAAAKESATSYKEQTDAIAQTKTNINGQIKALEELVGKENKTAAENARIKATVDELNKAIPDLNLEYDEMNGTLNKSIKSLRDVANAFLAQKKAEKIVERMIKLQEEQEAIAEELKEAEDALTTAKENEANAIKRATELGEGNSRQQQAATAAVAGYGGAAQMAADNVAALNSRLAENNAEMDGLDLDYAKLRGSADSTATSINNMADACGDAATAMRELTEEEIEDLQKIHDEAYDTATSMMDGFGKVKDATEASLKDFINAMKKRNDEARKYNDNLRELMKRGYDKALVETLTDGSEESMHIADLLVNGTEKQVKEFVDVWAEGAYDIKAESTALYTELKESAYKESHGIIDAAANGVNGNDSLKTSMRRQINDINAMLEADKNSGKYEALGEQLMNGIAEGIKKGAHGVKKAIGSTMTAVVNQGKVYAEIQSPSKKTAREIGKPLMQGVSKGFAAQVPDSFDEMRAALEAQKRVKLNSVSVTRLTGFETFGEQLKQLSGNQKITVESVVNLDGREVARTITPYVGEQLAWEGR